MLHVQYTSPIGCPVPVVVSVHDVSFLEHPEYFTRSRARQLQWTVRRTVHHGGENLDWHRVLAGIDPESLRRPGREQSRGSAERRSFGIPPDFARCGGGRSPGAFLDRRAVYSFRRDIQPRKNHIGLIRAFAKLVRAYPQLKQKPGAGRQRDMVFADRVRDAALDSGVGDRILFTGFVSDSDLLQLYNACDLFVFPSFYEGFGLPALEAMACGRAVVLLEHDLAPRSRRRRGHSVRPLRSG
jgi:glycosyltransferase involved in cell wall biosynthesis